MTNEERAEAIARPYLKAVHFASDYEMMPADEEWLDARVAPFAKIVQSILDAERPSAEARYRAVRGKRTRGAAWSWFIYDDIAGSRVRGLGSGYDTEAEALQALVNRLAAQPNAEDVARKLLGQEGYFLSASILRINIRGEYKMDLLENLTTALKKAGLR